MDPMLRRSPFGDEPEDEAGFLSGVAKIAFGIFLGVLMLWLVAAAVVRHQMSQVNVAVQQSLDSMQQRAQQAAQSRRDDQERRRRQEVRAQQIAADRRQAQLTAERRKDAAWAAFYQPSPQCLESTSVECGNAHIRARREFERRYAAGEL
ncbi:MAG TPA: hypothetical protein PKE27_23040 [Povalibacter sp.]|uniref:hypothetical protein n=1 Tax=Povalibacter sp. TaxID=1962978 RepID=UPI002C109986|nr:hypothetical protein [Povalibacter sp.]HMN47468.1 hypothetical protein [Povalibacter sp.]